MSEPRTVQRAEYVTPKKSEEEIIAKALKTEQTGTPREQNQQEITDNLIRLVFQGKKNFSEIASELGIGRTTAYRYWNDWKRTEEAQMVDWEWWALYLKLREVNPSKALECLTRIKHRMTTEHLEVKAEETITENIHYTYTEEQRKTLVEARRIIRDKEGSASRPSSLH